MMQTIAAMIICVFAFIGMAAVFGGIHQYVRARRQKSAIERDIQNFEQLKRKHKK